MRVPLLLLTEIYIMPHPEVVRFKILDQFPEIRCAFSTRRGGYSTGAYSELNMGLNTGDDRETVWKNRYLFFDSLGIGRERVAYPDQTHSNNVRVVNEPGIYRDCDALITNQAGVFLAVQTADCFPLFMYDPVKRVVAVVHAGWRGALAGIIEKTLIEMQKRFGSAMRDIAVAAGPAMQQECFEVDEDVHSQFDERYQVGHPVAGKKYIDLKKFINTRLAEAGIEKYNTELSEICTKCDKYHFYSYRRDGKLSGRMLGTIGIVH